MAYAEIKKGAVVKLNEVAKTALEIVATLEGRKGLTGHGKVVVAQPTVIDLLQFTQEGISPTADTHGKTIYFDEKADRHFLVRNEHLTVVIPTGKTAGDVLDEIADDMEEALYQQLDEAEAKIYELEARIEALEEEVEELETEVVDLEDQLADAQNLADEYESDLDDVRYEVDHLEDRVYELEHENESLQDEITYLEEQVEELSGENADLEERIEELEEEVEDLENELDR